MQSIINILLAVGIITTNFAVGLQIKSLKESHIDVIEVKEKQEYANNLAEALVYETSRAHEMNESLHNISKEYIKLAGELEWSKMETQMSNEYIQQLIKYIEDNDLTVPTLGEK